MNDQRRSQWLRLPWRLVLAGVVAVALMAAVEHSLSALRAVGEPAWGACWIWADVPLDVARPAAFLAVREFELAELPEKAWLSALADENFVLFLNGAYVGAGTYTANAPLARYRVEGLLRKGSNRLVVELRSRRGVGGFLANLLVEDGAGALHAAMVSDAEWRIFRHDERSTWRAGEPITGGEPAKVWQQSPTGRWRLRELGEDLPIPFRGKVHPLRVTAKREFKSRGVQQLYAWREVVDGFLLLDLPSANTPPALAWFGDEKPDPLSRPADELLIFLPGQRLWRDRHPRRFKYLLLVGLKPSEKPQVRRLDPKLGVRLRPPLPQEGVLGITPPQAHSEAEIAIWQRLRK